MSTVIPPQTLDAVLVHQHNRMRATETAVREAAQRLENRSRTLDLKTQEARQFFGHMTQNPLTGADVSGLVGLADDVLQLAVSFASEVQELLVMHHSGRRQLVAYESRLAEVRGLDTETATEDAG